LARVTEDGYPTGTTATTLKNTTTLKKDHKPHTSGTYPTSLTFPHTMSSQHEAASSSTRPPTSSSERLLTPENLGLRPLASICDIANRVESQIDFVRQFNEGYRPVVIKLAEDTAEALLDFRASLATSIIDGALIAYDWTKCPCELPPRADPNEEQARAKWNQTVAERQWLMDAVHKEVELLKSLVRTAREAIADKDKFREERESRTPPERPDPTTEQGGRSQAPAPIHEQRQDKGKNKRPREECEPTPGTEDLESIVTQILPSPQAKKTRLEPEEPEDTSEGYFDEPLSLSSSV
jgi:hypothetical protein